jgi:hypothetical protein
VPPLGGSQVASASEVASARYVCGARRGMPFAAGQAILYPMGSDERTRLLRDAVRAISMRDELLRLLKTEGEPR